MIMRRAVTLIALALWTLAVSAGAAAPAGAQTNDATAVNTTDGSSVFNLAFQVKKVNTSDVDAENTAVAFASCEDCRTIAGAIQVVLVTSDPEALEANNSAVAINYECSECDTLAAAYQFVVMGGDELQLSKEGKEQLKDLRKEFLALEERDDLTNEEIATEMARIAGEVAEVVDEELVTKAAEKAERKDDTSSTTTSVGTSGTGSASTSTTAGSASSVPASTSTSPSTTSGS